MRREIYVPVVAVFLAAVVAVVQGQRISTIQLDNVQYFVSKMNPYSPALNYFLAYQYCRSLGLQLTSFETREKADAITAYLKNAGYHKHDFWTSGNRLGTDMMLWMSTGLPFNATFDYMMKPGDEDGTGQPGENGTDTEESRSDDGASDGCIVLKAPHHRWATADCTEVKDFICEQTRCYYYNYGSVPVTTAQGLNKPSPTKLPPTSTEVPVTSPSTAAPIIQSSTTSTPPLNPVPPPPVELTLPSLLNITIRRGMYTRASPPPIELPSTIKTTLPPPTRAPVTVHANILARDKTHRLNEAPTLMDYNKHVARTIEGKNSNANVVYVKAVNAKNGQAAWSLAYVNKDNSSKSEEALIESRPTKQVLVTMMRHDDAINRRRVNDGSIDEHRPGA